MGITKNEFASKVGAILAAAGSAVGLGNVWRFPTETGANGGAAFILIYVLFMLLLGVPVMVTEFAIGRHGGENVSQAFEKMSGGKRGWRWMGMFPVVSGFLVLSYYAVVAGWTLYYAYTALLGGFQGKAPAEFASDFATFSSDSFSPVFWMILIIAMTCGIVAMGVQKGIERGAKVMMPLLFLIIIGIAIRSMTLPGSAPGLDFLFRPDWSKVTSQTFLAALGQAFFSLSLGSCMVVTYASYVKKEANIISLSSQTAVADTLFAIIAGCAIMPAVFAFGISPGEGPDLVFVTLPHIFSQMPLGGVIAIFFFVALLLAALTSSISMLEVIVAFCIEEFKMKRKVAVLVVFVFIWILGCLCSLSMGPLSDWKILGKTIFDLFDFISADFLMLLGGLLIVIFAGWKLGKAAVFDELTNGGTHPVPAWLLKTILFLIRYVAPAALLAIAIFQVHE